MNQGSQQQIPCGTGIVVELAASSKERVRIVFSVDSGVGYVTDRPGSVAGTGFPITSDRALVMDREDYGDMVQHSWFGSVLGTGLIFGVIDVQQPGRVGA